MPPRADTHARMTAAERREQLLYVTNQIVAERGFRAVSSGVVAGEAGIQRPSVYGHFTGLRGLLEALVDGEGERALAQLAPFLPAVVGRGDPRQQLLAGLRRYPEA